MKINRQLSNAVKFIGIELDYCRQKPQRILFDHLPKCAGTTVTEYLILHFPHRYIFNTNRKANTESVRIFKELPQRTRYSYQLIIGHLSHHMLDYVHPDTIAATVFRDPVDRIISHYYYVKRTKEHYLHQWVVGNGIQLVDYCCSPPTIELRNWYTTHYSGLDIQEAEGKGEESVYRALRAITQKYKLVGFQDDLPSFIHKLKDMARLSKPFDNKKRNMTKGRSGIEDISNTIRGQIANINFLDVQLYSMLKEQVNSSPGKEY